MGTETGLRIMVLLPYSLSNNFGGSLLSKFSHDNQADYKVENYIRYFRRSGKEVVELGNVSSYIS